MTDGEDSRLDVSNPDEASLEEPVEAYETEGLMVLYEATNPLAWIESSVAYTIEDAT